MKRIITINRVKRFFKFFAIAVAILIVGFLTAAQIAYSGIAEIDPPPGMMYSINDGEIHMYCTGPENENQPTIIIIAGAGVPSFLYSPLQDKLSETIRTCSYDSAGIGWSKANDIPYTAKNLSDELHQLLQAAHINGPIILAGHSLGGIVSLIYSAEHEQQVAGIAFIDSSHYNQTDYFGEEFKNISDKQIDEQLANLWLMELASNLGIFSLMSIFDTHESEEFAEEHKMLESFNKWNPPYPTIKSMLSNLNLSFEQGKEVHYARGDLPIISISASGEISGDPTEIGGISAEEYREGFKDLHKDLAELSTNGRYVVVNETNHISIAYNDETADHVLSLIPNTDEHSVYSLPFGMNQQNVKLQLNVNPQYVKNPGNPDELILDIDAMIQVHKIFDKCDYKQKLESGEIPSRNPDDSFNVITGSLPFFNNGTHYIDSNVCTWIDSFKAVTYTCFDANPMVQNWYDGPSYFYNNTHHIDVQYCKWTLFYEGYWDLSLCDPDPEQNFGKCREFK